MYALLTVVLALASVNAQTAPNQTCCPPTFYALGYNGLHDFLFDFYFDSTTGDNLEVDHRGEYMIFSESSTGRFYTRKLNDSSCTFVEYPELKDDKRCIMPFMSYLGSEMLDGVLYHEWHGHEGELDVTLVKDALCVTKIHHSRVHNEPVISHVYFNQTVDADVSMIHDFVKDGCVKSS